MADDDVEVKFGATVDGALDGISSIVENLESMTGPIGALVSHFKELGEAIVAALAINKVLDFVDAIAEAGAKVEHLAVALGITATEMSEFAGVAQLMDVGTDQIGASLTRMERAAAQAGAGTGAAAKAFADLGVKVTDSNGNMKSLAQLLPEVAEGFKNNANHMQAVSDLLAIGGRGMKNLIPIFAEGKEGLAEYTKAVDETGSVMNNQMAEGFEKTAIKTTLFHESMDGLKITLAEALKPAVDTIYDSLTHFIENLNNALQSGGALHPVIIGLAAAFDLVVTAIDILVTGLILLGDVFGSAFTTINTILLSFSTVAYDVFSGQWGKALEDSKAGLTKIGQTWTDFYTRSSKELEDFVTRQNNMWSKLGDTGDRTKDKPTPASGKPEGGENSKNAEKLAEAELAAKEKVALAKIAIEQQADKEAFALGMETIQQLYEAEVANEQKILAVKLEAANAKLASDQRLLAAAKTPKDQTDAKAKIIADNAQIEALQVQHEATMDKLYAERLDKEQQMRQQDLSNFIQNDNAKLKSGMNQLDEDYKDHKITVDKKAALERDLTNKIIDEEITRLAVERDKHAQGTAEYQQYVQKIEQLEDEKKAKLSQIDDDVAAHQRQVSDRIAREFGSTLSTMLTSTQTWQQQVVAVLNRMVDIFIQEVVEPMIASWIRSEFMKTAATTAGEQSRVAAKQAGAAEGALVEKESSLASIFQNAYKAAAATYASVSEIPIVGPFLAPPAAAAAFVAVAAFGSALPSAAGGMVVQEDTLAQVHKNEMVLPAHLSSGLSSIIANGKRGSGDVGLTYAPTINHNEPASLHQMLTDEASTMRAWLANQSRDGHLPFGA